MIGQPYSEHAPSRDYLNLHGMAECRYLSDTDKAPTRTVSGLTGLVVIVASASVANFASTPRRRSPA